jgi:hypothetical protein
VTPAPSPPIKSRASPLASSSEITLDDFPSLNSSDPIIASLNYATDTELIDALLAEPPAPPPMTITKLANKYANIPQRRIVSPFDLDWKSSVDPAFAFLALRTRPTFGRFIEYIRPRVKQVYTALRPSGMHQLFASDVLIRNGDSRVIRELLEMDGEHKRHFRSSAAVSMYEHIRPALEAGRVDPLSANANIAISKALMAEGNIDLIPKIYDDLYATVEWQPSESWVFFSIILYMTRQNRIDEALVMLQRLVADERLPSGASGKSDPKHPEAKVLLVQTMIVRASLQFKLYDRLTTAADDLLATIARSAVSAYVPELILQLCRACIVGRIPTQVAWAGSFLLKYAKLPNTPPLPSSIINTYLEHSGSGPALRFYMDLPDNHEPPSPRAIIRLATARPRREVMYALLKDIQKIPPSEFAAQRGQFLQAMVKTKDKESVVGLYEAWKGTFELNPHLVYQIIALLCSSKKSANQYSEQVRLITRHYWNNAQRKSSKWAVDNLVLTRIYLLRQNPLKASAHIDNAGYLKEIDVRDPEAKKYIAEVLREDPGEGYMFVRYLRDQGLDFKLATTDVVNACLRGHWDALDSLKPSSDLDNTSAEGSAMARLLAVLRSIRQGKVTSARERIVEMVAKKDDVPILLQRALILRCAYLKRWHTATQSWLDALVPSLSSVDQVVMRKTGIVVVRHLKDFLGSEMTDEEVSDTVELLDGVSWKAFGEKMRGIEIDDEAWDETERKAELSDREYVREIVKSVGSLLEEVKEERKSARSGMRAFG